MLIQFATHCKRIIYSFDCVAGEGFRHRRHGQARIDETLSLSATHHKTGDTCSDTKQCGSG